MRKENRLSCILLSLICMSWIGVHPSSLSFGQSTEEPPKKKSKLDVEEEEAPPAKAAEPPKKSKLDVAEEEEAPPPKKAAAKPGIEEEETPGVKPGKPSNFSVEPGSEEDEKKQERVCDRVHFSQMFINVVLFPTPFEVINKNEEIPFKRVTSSEKGFTTHRIKGSQITRISYYEERMLEKAAEALGLTVKRMTEPGAAIDVSTPPALERATKAEAILVRALAEHDSAVQANLRKGNQWDPLFRFPLLTALLNIRLAHADVLLAEGKLDQAERAYDKLKEDFRDLPKATADLLLRSRFEKILLTQADQAAKAGQFADARRLLSDLSRRFPRETGGLGGEFQKGLIKQAKDLVAQAEALPPERNREKKALLSRAAGIWPELPGLDALRRQADSEYRILQCAYTSLPENFSPLLAHTPVERHAVSLMFESLVRWWDGKTTDDDEGQGGHYEPQLAASRPVPLARGRQFFLHECQWSDSTVDQPHVLTMADVRFTTRLMADSNVPGHLPAWTKLVRDDVQMLHKDPFTACIWLNRDHWQPLSLMDFKIMPQRSFPQGTAAELMAFNKSPVGTGPYVLGQSDDPSEVRFVANPHYRYPGKPQINEIIFRRLDPAVAKEQFLQGNVHLVFDLQPEHVSEIKQQRRTVKKVKTPSVWFLAPRYSSNSPSQLDDANLRLAIMHGINRETILDQYYRTGSTKGDHVALTGPYPKGTWAYLEGLNYTPIKADTYAREARKTLKSLRPLRLVYPDEGPNSITERACKEMQTQLASLSIELTLEPVTNMTATLDAGNFDLAYWRHDFKDETYWLWPLLDPQGIPTAANSHGTNFMRKPPDTDLGNLFNQINSHKRFPEIQDLTHKVHRHIFENAFVIPLWQLDTYVAVDDALKDLKLDPWVLYGNVEDWRLDLRSK